jgi:xyloglucan-specific exo-beta-1,4-glucanase
LLNEPTSNPQIHIFSGLFTMIVRFLSVLVFWQAATALAAEPYVWRNIKVGGGGFIPGIVFSTVEPGLAYLRSDMGGAYRWDSTKQEWLALHDHLAESNYFGTESVAPDPVDANIVYLAAGMYSRDGAAMMRSRDRGNTWEIFPVEFVMGGNENGRGVGERLAIDPQATNILYFGSRYEGLWKSTDSAETWERVESFPLAGTGKPRGGFGGFANPNQGAGLSFVVFKLIKNKTAEPTQEIYVGSTDPGEHHLLRSRDSGETWEIVPGGPDEKMLPSHAAFDADGVLYISYGNGVGPNDVTDGAVWKLDTDTDQWTDITPDKSPSRPKGGYGGIAVDRQQPNTVAVATLDRWEPTDTVWRSTDGGSTWKDMADKWQYDVSETPFLYWGREKPEIGWWMTALAIDPFDSNYACYATGATVSATRDFGKINAGEPTLWKPWVTGIEQTAVIGLMSPAAGPHLISGFGDISGFTHEDFSVSPPIHTNPTFTNTNLLDYAGRAPQIIIRAGIYRETTGPTLAYSEDAGRTWQPLVDPPQPDEPVDDPSDNSDRARFQRFMRGRSGVGFAVSADGKTMIVTPRVAMVTDDRGKTWNEVAGLPARVRPVADRVNAEKFYAINFANGDFYVSADRGHSFSKIESSGLPDTERDTPRNREAMWPLQATLEQEGDLWYIGRAGLFHSKDGGATFEKIESAPEMNTLSFGKAPAGKDYPALYCVGNLNGKRGVWRSLDEGESWERINDDQHQWGGRFRCIAGDPRIFGRVYVGTDGRGIVYGEPR